VALGRIHRYETIAVSDTTLAIDLDDQETRVVRRTTSTPVTNIKSNRPRPVPLFTQCRTSPGTKPSRITCLKTRVH